TQERDRRINNIACLEQSAGRGFNSHPRLQHLFFFGFCFARCHSGLLAPSLGSCPILECQEFARLTVWHFIKEVKYLERTVRHDGVCFSGGSTGPLSRLWSFGISSKYGRITGEFDWLKAS